MQMDFNKFKEAASGGRKTPETTGDGFSDLESALDQIQRAKEMERRLQEQVGPSLSEQALELAQDPKIQQAAREIWYGPEEAATGGSSRPTNGASDGPGRPDRAEVTPEVTPEVTESAESGVTSLPIEPVKRNLGAIDDYEKIDRIATGRDVLEFGIVTTDTGSHRVTITDGDEVVQYPADEFMEWAERQGFYDRSDHTENRRQKVRKRLDEWFSTTREKVVFTLAVHEYHGESSLFESQEDIADFLDTSGSNVRNIKSEFSGATITIFDEIEVTL